MVANLQSRKAMKCRLIYVDGHLESMKQCSQAYNSFSTFKGWEVEKFSGITYSNIEKQKEFSYPVKKNSRLLNFQKENKNRFLTKLSCAINHVKFWKEVVKRNEPMVFLEHDAICVGDWKNLEFDEYLILNAQHVFRKPNKLALSQFLDYTFPGDKGVYSLPKNYRLQYYRDNDWKGSNMVPGTGAYAITPKGAKKMIEVVKTGIDQSDFMLNSHNINIEYLLPSPIKFNKKNLSTSYGV
ncbi:glycosyltransferase family 25 protein [bacterium]|nr:glycosyltransferase family 25 protein [bacterium]